ncbi:unnamed protein product [Bursaphelenchus okinawaensis]|uniref:Trafficking protein particle complex subunit n=1 Tax=Bursaphelenchus okinawaensis TaxID=465554 RepID=A0A811KQS4_9BILA|nr:unnamed protein product [Bursaphelenchus okinawaensis]CAG9108556.1 unnamed protein product [Bursaphelenchus okinawaensis]
MVLALSVLSKDKSLIYFQCSSERINEETAIQMMAYSALDVLDEWEKVPSNRPQELFQGCLLFNNTYKVFGYVTNTQVNFILTYDASDSSNRDQDVRMLFKKLHNHYVDEVSNPFYVPGAFFTTTNFKKFVNTLL